MTKLDKLITLRFKKWDTNEIIEIMVFSWFATSDGVGYRESTQSHYERSSMPESEAYLYEVC